jgi:hypothetical protein
MNGGDDERDTRRGHPRYAVDVEVTLTLDSGLRVRARTRDLSRTGICVITGESLPGGETVRIDLVLAFGDNAFSEPLTLGARVVWCTNIASSFQVGAMFDDLTEQQDGFLEMFLHFLDGTIAPRGGRQDDEDDDDPLPGPDETDDPFRS